MFTLNNIELPGSEASATCISTYNITGTTPIANPFLATLQANDVVRLAAHDTSGRTQLAGIGYGLTAPSVSLTIVRLR